MMTHKCLDLVCSKNHVYCCQCYPKCPVCRKVEKKQEIVENMERGTEVKVYGRG